MSSTSIPSRAAHNGAPRSSVAPRRALFVSDLHLRAEDPQGVERAAAFLDHARAIGVDALFLLGDVFAAWLGPPSLSDPGLAPVLDRLAALGAEGVRVVLLHGNHDFLLGPEIERALGVTVAGAAHELALGGQRVRLVHGDVFCTRDLGYQRLHRVLRSRPGRSVWGALPTAALRRVAASLTRTSNRTTARKSAEDMAMVDAAVSSALHRGPDVIVAGHVHVARDALLPVPGGHGRLMVMADFETSGSHALWDAGQLSLVRSDDRFAPPLSPVLAMDGPAGSGKSAVAKALARRLGWMRLDSGALYRAVALAAVRAGLTHEDPEVDRLVGALSLASDAAGRVYMDGRPLDDHLLRAPEVSALVSPLSARPAVRAALMPVQRAAARGVAGLVAEGRDMATVVFPEALAKVYLDARLEVRAGRRLAQGGGEGASLERVAAALAERDARDQGREVAPLQAAHGAFVLDTSDLSLEQVVDRLQQRLSRR